MSPRLSTQDDFFEFIPTSQEIVGLMNGDLGYVKRATDGAVDKVFEVISDGLKSVFEPSEPAPIDPPGWSITDHFDF